MVFNIVWLFDRDNEAGQGGLNGETQ